MTRWWILWSLAAVCLPASIAVPAAASEVEDGKRLYRVHCLACHGETGRGDGPMTDQLEKPAPDLTTIAKENGGEFPTEAIHQIIDGRHESPAHGTRAMPVWGFTFQSTGHDTDQELEVRGMIAALTAYLESLQVASPVSPRADATSD